MYENGEREAHVLMGQGQEQELEQPQEPGFKSKQRCTQGLYSR